MRRLTIENAHLTDDQLLLFMDGEMKSGEVERVAAHLQSCWSCRGRLERIGHGIADVSNFCVLAQYTYPDPTPNLRNSLISRLEREPKVTLTRRVLSAISVHLVPFQRSYWLAPVAGVALTLAVVGSVLVTKQPQTVTAAVVLEKALNAERGANDMPGNVVHRTVTLEERDSSEKLVSKKRIETWRDGGGRAARRVYSDNGQLAAGDWRKPDGSRVVYENTKLRSNASAPQSPLTDDAIWQLLPSAENFMGVTGHPDKVTIEEQPAVYVLRYRNDSPQRKPRLLNASLTLRRTDLHAVEQTLRIERDGETRGYHFVETGFEQRPAAEVVATVFNVDAGLRETASRIEPVHVEPLFVPATADLEVEAMDRLDRTDALLRNQVRISHTAQGALLIQGVVETEERKKEVVGALGPLAYSPAVRVAINTVSEAEQQQLKTPPMRLQVQSVEVTADAQQGNPDIRRYLATTKQLSGEQLETELHRFSYGVCNHLAEAQLQALTLRQVVEAFSTAELNSMTPGTKQQWQALVRKHAKGTQREIRAVLEDLGPIFRPLLATKPGQLAPTDIKSAVVQISGLTAATDKVVWKALATSSDEASAQLRSPEFWESLQNAEQIAVSIVEGFR